jgi:hypothetical protein
MVGLILVVGSGANMSLQKSRNGRKCPTCGETYKHVIDGDPARRECGCVVTIVETPDEIHRDTDTARTIDTDNTVFTTLDEWIDSSEKVATDGGERP